MMWTQEQSHSKLSMLQRRQPCGSVKWILTYLGLVNINMSLTSPVLKLCFEHFCLWSVTYTHSSEVEIQILWRNTSVYWKQLRDSALIVSRCKVKCTTLLLLLIFIHSNHKGLPRLLLFGRQHAFNWSCSFDPSVSSCTVGRQFLWST